MAIVLLFAAASIASAEPPPPGQLFGTPTTYVTATSSSFPLLCDLDGDGNMDVVSADR
jgi:hypothetical protein